MNNNVPSDMIKNWAKDAKVMRGKTIFNLILAFDLGLGRSNLGHIFMRHHFVMVETFAN